MVVMSVAEGGGDNARWWWDVSSAMISAATHGRSARITSTASSCGINERNSIKYVTTQHEISSLRKGLTNQKSEIQSSMGGVRTQTYFILAYLCPPFRRTC